MIFAPLTSGSVVDRTPLANAAVVPFTDTDSTPLPTLPETYTVLPVVIIIPVSGVEIVRSSLSRGVTHSPPVLSRFTIVVLVREAQSVSIDVATATMIFVPTVKGTVADQIPPVCVAMTPFTVICETLASRATVPVTRIELAVVIVPDVGVEISKLVNAVIHSPVVGGVVTTPAPLGHRSDP